MTADNRPNQLRRDQLTGEGELKLTRLPEGLDHEKAVRELQKTIAASAQDNYRIMEDHICQLEAYNSKLQSGVFYLLGKTGFQDRSLLSQSPVTREENGQVYVGHVLITHTNFYVIETGCPITTEGDCCVGGNTLAGEVEIPTDYLPSFDQSIQLGEYAKDLTITEEVTQSGQKAIRTYIPQMLDQLYSEDAETLSFRALTIEEANELINELIERRVAVQERERQALASRVEHLREHAQATARPLVLPEIMTNQPTTKPSFVERLKITLNIGGSKKRKN